MGGLCGHAAAGLSGARFQLKTDYPKTLPDYPRPWEAIDVRTQPRAYVAALKRYVYAGMAEVDFVPRKNRVHQWYHMPWHHLGRLARERVHGLTRQRDVKHFELAPTQNQPQQKWELTLYRLCLPELPQHGQLAQSPSLYPAEGGGPAHAHALVQKPEAR